MKTWEQIKPTYLQKNHWRKRGAEKLVSSDANGNAKTRNKEMKQYFRTRRQQANEMLLQFCAFHATSGDKVRTIWQQAGGEKKAGCV